MRPVCFSRVEFTLFVNMGSGKMPTIYDEYLGLFGREHTIVLDLLLAELSYQVFVVREDTPLVVVDSGRKVRGIPKGYYFKQKELFSYGYKLTPDELREVIPYCNALEYEAYRGKTMSMKDEGYRGYRDEVSMHFTAVTESYIPKLELPMDYIYDEEHTWPHERLYKYVVKKYLESNEELGVYKLSYRTGTLFW